MVSNEATIVFKDVYISETYQLILEVSFTNFFEIF